jgi:1-aminocyclopropane-1-carboxylate deaminase/D-cysteine desulfhydrase-like pyridoxal-dependent ACC family enzyme
MAETVTRAQVLERLERLPRITLGHFPTPLEACPRLSAALGGPRIWIKRDDCTGLALGGNKTRQLEYLLGEVLAKEADVVVHGAALQSNYCRQLTAAAARLGLECHLLLSTAYQPPVVQGNLLLMQLGGAHIHLTPTPLSVAFEQEKAALAESLRAAGRRPYLVSYPSSETLATAAYLRAAVELDAQFEQQGVTPRYLYLSAVGGTQAGLLLGSMLLGSDYRVRGISPLRWDLDSRGTITRAANRVAGLLDFPLEITPDAVDNDEGYVGERYATLTPAGVAALRLLARTEGIFLDPVYTAKALSALIDHVRRGLLTADQQVVFVHTGGVPALFAYSEGLSEPLSD